MKQTLKSRFRHRTKTALMLLAWAAALGGCSSNLNNFGDPSTTGGASTVSQARQEAPNTPPPAYPLVHDMPAPRNSVILTDYEQKKLENDLIAARRRVAPEADKPAAKAKSDKGKSETSKSAAPQNTGNKPNP